MGLSLKPQRGYRDDGGLLNVVVGPAAVGLLKADLCSPGWLCRGVVAGLV